MALQFLKRGIHVICDKPLTATLPEAKKLAKAAEASGVVFALTHNYTGYPMIRQAKAMVAGGELGDLRLVQVEYAQDWLTEPVEASGQKQADWRTDPARTGAGGSTGDIGTHAFNLANFVTGLTLDQLAADLTAFVPGRRVDDNGHVLLRYQGGAKGMLWCSQVAPGNENALRLRVYGTRGGLEWAQEDPNYLWFTPFGQPKRLITRGGAGSGPEAARMTRVPPGHPEGYLEGFANIYAEAARAIHAAKAGTSPPKDTTFPGLKEGLDGVAFIDACVRSSARNASWVSLNL
ncbi:MAG: oxidoreductase [Rhodobacterales bacterium 12-65-15]|nr:MAG: oxidoreductase [Rhodobacterales bacterium 12-65-15]